VQTSTWWSSSRKPVRMHLRMLHHDDCWAQGLKISDPSKYCIVCMYICISVQTSTWWSSSRKAVRMHLRKLHHDYCWVDAESALGKVILLLILLCSFFIRWCLPHSVVFVLWFNMWLVSRVPFCAYFLNLWSLGTTYCFVEWILLVWFMADDFGWIFPPCGSERIYDLNATCGKQAF